MRPAGHRCDGPIGAPPCLTSCAKYPTYVGIMLRFPTYCRFLCRTGNLIAGI